MDIAVVFIFGLIIGSFLNVVIYRLPKGESLIFPASHCPKCNKKIKFYDNIPVFGYIFLGGKCRHCHNKIGKIYPAIEIITATLFTIDYLHRGAGLLYLYEILLISIFVCIFMIDLKHMIIPDILNLMLAIGAFGPIAMGRIDITTALTGGVLGGAVLFIIAMIGPMGGGDIKFMAAMGLWLGIIGTGLALWIAFVVGGIIGVVLLLMKIKKRGDNVAFGPYLIIGSFIAYFFQNVFFQFYLNLIH